MAGAGHIALRRLKTLLGFTESVTVTAPEVTAEFEELCACHQGVTLLKRPFCEGDLEGVYMAFACTDRPEVNEQIVKLCKEKGILVNDCSKKENCDFYFPGIVEKDGAVIGITASGTDHGGARRLRQKIEDLLREEENG